MILNLRPLQKWRLILLLFFSVKKNILFSKQWRVGNSGINSEIKTAAWDGYRKYSPRFRSLDSMHSTKKSTNRLTKLRSFRLPRVRARLMCLKCKLNVTKVFQLYTEFKHKRTCLQIKYNMKDYKYRVVALQLVEGVTDTNRFQGGTRPSFFNTMDSNFNKHKGFRVIRSDTRNTVDTTR